MHEQLGELNIRSQEFIGLLQYMRVHPRQNPELLQDLIASEAIEAGREIVAGWMLLNAFLHLDRRFHSTQKLCHLKFTRECILWNRCCLLLLAYFHAGVLSAVEKLNPIVVEMLNLLSEDNLSDACDHLIFYRSSDCLPTIGVWVKINFSLFSQNLLFRFRNVFTTVLGMY